MRKGSANAKRVGLFGGRAMKAEYHRNANAKYLVLRIRSSGLETRINVENIGKWACDHDHWTSDCGRCWDCGSKIELKKISVKPDLYYKAKSEEERRTAVLLLMGVGWVLCCWRKSSPHNWFLSHTNIEEQINLGRNDFDRCWVKKISNSRERVIQYWGADSGMPVLTKYVLRKRPYRIKLPRRKGFLSVTGWFQRERINAAR